MFDSFKELRKIATLFSKRQLPSRVSIRAKHLLILPLQSDLKVTFRVVASELGLTEQK